MRSHLANLPLPPKTPQKHSHDHNHLLNSPAGESTESSSLLSSYEDDSGDKEVKENEEKGLIYGLRENPKRSSRFADTEFLDAGSVLFQDRESETETESARKQTRRRSKRTRRSMLVGKKQKQTKPISNNSSGELEPVSSISNTSPEENLALCLIMLSKDVWCNSDDSEVRKLSRTRGKSVKKIKENCGVKIGSAKSLECPFLGKVFGSGQVLGGHKRSHLSSSSTTTLKVCGFESEVETSRNGKVQVFDLNLPASMEEENGEEDFSGQQSAVSDANFINPINH